MYSANRPIKWSVRCLLDTAIPMVLSKLHIFCYTSNGGGDIV